MSLARKVCLTMRSMRFCCGSVFGQLLFAEQLDVVGDDRERRVDFVGHAGGKQAQRGELLGLHQLFLGAHLLGHVIDQDQAAGGCGGLTSLARSGGQAGARGERGH